MKRILAVSVSIAMLSLVESAQPPTSAAPGDTLLNHLTGNWILHGTIAGRETTHDVDSEWVLNHEYVRLHEVSREKNTAGQAAYEAIVFIAWDQTAGEYLCLWLDSTAGGGLNGPMPMASAVAMRFRLCSNLSRVAPFIPPLSTRRAAIAGNGLWMTKRLVS